MSEGIFEFKDAEVHRWRLVAQRLEFTAHGD